MRVLLSAAFLIQAIAFLQRTPTTVRVTPRSPATRKQFWKRRFGYAIT